MKSSVCVCVCVYACACVCIGPGQHNVMENRTRLCFFSPSAHIFKPKEKKNIAHIHTHAGKAGNATWSKRHKKLCSSAQQKRQKSHRHTQSHSGALNPVRFLNMSFFFFFTSKQKLCFLMLRQS